jgi:hypothetical protein
MAVAITARFAVEPDGDDHTVRDRTTDLVIVHGRPWDAETAAFVVAELEEDPRRIALFDDWRVA